MIKKALLVSFAASILLAGQYTTLKDGRTIVMHDNGTWEEVTVVRSGDAQVGVMAAKDLAGSPKAIEVNEPLARMLVGKWSTKDGAVAYDFRNDGYVTYTLDGSTGTEGYSIQFLDSKDNTISVSIGDSSRYGKVIFGGKFRKFKISKDGKNMVDYSDEMSKLVTFDLRKTGEAISSPTAPTTPTVKAVTLPAKTDSSKGFVK
jgi:hypothetical protein